MAPVLLDEVGWDEDVHVVVLEQAAPTINLVLVVVGWLRHLVWLVHGAIRGLILLDLGS